MSEGMAHIRNVPGSGILHMDARRVPSDQLLPCECGRQPGWRHGRGRVWVSCPSCPKSTGTRPRGTLIQSVLTEAWNKIAATPWRELSKKRKR